VLPEVTSPALTGNHGSDRVRMTDRATGSDVTPKGFHWVRACATGSWVPTLVGPFDRKLGFPALVEPF